MSEGKDSREQSKKDHKGGWSNVGISCVAARLLSNGPKGRCCNQGGVVTEALTVFSPSVVHRYPPVHHFLYASVEIQFEDLPRCYNVCLDDLHTVRWGAR